MYSICLVLTEIRLFEGSNESASLEEGLVVFGVKHFVSVDITDDAVKSVAT